MSRAEEAWQLIAGRITRGPAGLVREPGSQLPVACWPLSQVIHAAALQSPDTVPRLFRGARAYRRGDGYLEFPGRGKRYYGDNAWMALASLQHYQLTGDLRALSRAQWVERFLRTGAVDGGCKWVEGGDTVNACSTGSVGLVASALGRDAAPQLRALAELRRGDGVVADHRRADGSIEPAAFSYNQGLLIGLAHRCGEKRLLAEAVDAGAGYYTDERLWEQPVAFNAVYARGLASAGASMRRIASYADALWELGRDERGWFTGAGRYDEGKVLDTAAATQIFRLLEGIDSSLIL